METPRQPPRRPQRPSTRPEKVGLVGQHVAENIKALRERRGGMSVRDLSAKLTELGRPILPSGITKIEQGERRVDADDLVALATVLGVPPSRLLLRGSGLEDEENVMAAIEKHNKSGALTDILEGMVTAVHEDGVEPGWLSDFLELNIQWLPIYVKALRGELPHRKKDDGEHQEAP